jgi:phospholipid transport system transporter-binding protein
VIALPAELTQAQASVCLQVMLQGLSTEAGPHVVVNGAALQRFDSSALAVLLELRRQCAAAGKQLRVSGLPERLSELAGLYGVAGLFPDNPAIA